MKEQMEQMWKVNSKVVPGTFQQIEGEAPAESKHKIRGFCPEEHSHRNSLPGLW